MGKGKYVAGVLIKRILSCFYDGTEENSSVTTEDTDQRGYEKDGNVLIETIAVKGGENPSADGSYRSERQGTSPKAIER